MRPNRWLALASILFLVASVNACSSDSSAPAPIVAPDSGELIDAQPDASVDAAHDTSQDPSPQDVVAQDTAAETAQDAGQEVGPDASDDAVEDVVQEPLQDAGAEADGSPQDAPAESADPDAPCVPLGGLGTVACTCNGLSDVQWTSNDPYLFEDHIDFGTIGWDKTQLTSGALKIFETPNLGGNSVESEATAFEVLARCDFATLIKTEAEIDYQQDGGGKKTDILVQIDGRKVGVSVVRAYHYPPSEPYTVTDATNILTKKLTDIPLSAANAVPADAWERSMLAVVAWNQQTADTVVQVWNNLDPNLRGNVILALTVTDGDDSALY